MIKRFVALSSIALFLILPGFLPGTAGAQPQITGVEMEYGLSGTKDTTRRYTNRSLNKFSRPNLRPTSQNFYVNWKPGSTAVPKGAKMVFEYRHASSPKAQALAITYPFDVTSARRPTFTIAEQAFSAAGPVKSWRVRLFQGTVVLAQSQSRNWR